MGDRSNLGWLLAAALAVGAAGGAQAQERPARSPEILLITQESLKPGKSAAYARSRVEIARAIEGKGGARPSIVLKSISGPDEVWRLDFAGALADLEGLNDPSSERDEDLLARVHRVTALHQAKVSYQPQFDWARVRYLDVIAVHVRPGKHPEYNELRRMSKAAHDKGGLDGPLLVYKATSGVKGLVWMILRPLTSLGQHDRLRADGFGEPLTDAEDKRMTELRAASMEYAEERFFRVAPELSSVPRSWDEAGPAFWHAR